MKKITFLIFLVCTMAFAQVPPTFSWTNKADYQINGESAVTFKPGQEITVEITYTVGSTATPNPNEFWFILVGLQDEPMADVDPLTGTWANDFVTPEQYPGAGTGGVTTATFTVPMSTPLNSSNPNLTYRMLNYMAYWDGDIMGTRDGSNATYGGPGASDPTLVYIRSQAEIDALSTVNFNKNKLDAFYSADRSAIVFQKNIDGDFKIFNMVGQSVQEGKVSKEVRVETLKTGLYILTTDYGTLKFVK